MSLVPITSDLAGYAAFWQAVIWRVIVGLMLALSPVYVLLYLIWKK